MKPSLVLIAIALLIAPAMTAFTHSRPVAERGGDKNSHDAAYEQGKAPPTDHESLGAFPTAVNSQVT
jgi:hypothetical protein